MSNPQKTPMNVWPLGKITVTHGTPASILSNVGTQDAGFNPSQLDPQGKAYSSTCTQLIFSCPSTNTSDVLITYGNFAAPDTNLTMLAVAKGVTLAIPAAAEIQSGQIDLKQFYVDGTTTNDVVYVTAIGGN